MRILFVAGLACSACGLEQKTPMPFNNSEVSSSEDIVSMQKDASGTYTVTCQDGTKEYKVTLSQIQNNQVCNAPPPRDGAEVNSMAFNAFDIWRNAHRGEILDYPQGYQTGKSPTIPDGVFYVDGTSFWRGGKFVGVPTEGAKVVGDLLEYPVKNGKQLKLKFTGQSPTGMTHADAVKYCKQQGLRLPTVRELFDFCAAGVTEPNYGPNYKEGSYPFNARCKWGVFWSASVATDSAWGGVWSFQAGEPSTGFPSSEYDVRCVARP